VSWSACFPDTVANNVVWLARIGFGKVQFVSGRVEAVALKSELTECADEFYLVENQTN
jgi:hypothetical protein